MALARMIPAREFIFADPARVQLDPPPQLVVTSGRQSIMASLVLKRRLGAKVFTVHTQDPRIDPRRFDLVACPAHDGLVGPNVVGTFGAIHHITRELLDEHAAQGPIGGLEKLGRPFALVLLGGPTRNYPYSAEALFSFQQRLESMAKSTGCALAILPSKRTPPDWVTSFTARFAGEHLVWSGQGRTVPLGVGAGLALRRHLRFRQHDLRSRSHGAPSLRRDAPRSPDLETVSPVLRVLPNRWDHTPVRR